VVKVVEGMLFQLMQTGQKSATNHKKVINGLILPASLTTKLLELGYPFMGLCQSSS
jgi:hypothetical protein